MYKSQREEEQSQIKFQRTGKTERGGKSEPLTNTDDVALSLSL